MRWTVIVLWACLCVGVRGSLPPAALGDAVINAATGLNSMKISPAWRRISSTVNTSAGLRAALRRLQGGAARAAQLVHGLVDRLRVGEGPLVKTRLGTLRGRYLVTRTADPIQYYGFRGVRYAQPPTGKLRFRAPRPLAAWRGRRDALDEGAVCPHRSLLFDNYKGDEDCLFLNLYTPALPDKVTGFTPRLPVMVWLHGGAWSVGSGNSFLYGPDRLIPAGVILVTLNYRLGPLGFLSLEDDEITGNMALKDQIIALEWVRDNIEFFGGDPNRVTLFGESAGAVSVHMHLLSPVSRGLFHAAIAQSGSALSDWAVSPQPRQTAFDLGRILGIDTNSSAELLGFLRATPPETLVAAANKMSLEASRAGFPFAPVVDGLGGVLPASPELLLQSLDPAVPFLTGFNAQEGIIVYRRLRKQPDLLQRMESEFWRAVPRSLDTSGSRGFNTLQAAADRIRRFYFQDRTISLASIDGVIDLFTDALFMVPTITSIRKQQSMVPKQQVYLYRFAFDGALGLFKRMLGLQHPGACHGDELGYLFHFGNLNLRLDENSPELAVARRMVKMWTNFAKTGNPTPNALDRDGSDLAWKPVSPVSLDRLNYLDIGVNFTARTQPEAKRLRFWDQLYQDFNGDTWT